MPLSILDVIIESLGGAAGTIPPGSRVPIIYKALWVVAAALFVLFLVFLFSLL